MPPPNQTRPQPPSDARSGRARRADESAKILFIAPVVEDMLRATAPALSAVLDLDAIAAAPVEFISLDREKRVGDAVFQVPFRQAGPGGRRRVLLVGVEFQARQDAGMLRRVREYTEYMVEHYRHQGVLGADDDALVMAYVVHTGPAPWRAPDGAEAVRGLPPEVVRELALYQPQAYMVLDAGPGSSTELPEENRFTAAMRLVGCAVEELPAVFLREFRRFSDDPAHESLRRGMYAWVSEALLGSPESGVTLPSFEALEGKEESEMTYLFERQFNEMKEKSRLLGVEEGRQEGRQEGHVEGQRQLLVTLAADRFGGAAAAGVSEALNGQPTNRRLAEVGKLIVSCEASDDLLGRLGNRDPA